MQLCPERWTLVTITRNAACHTPVKNVKEEELAGFGKSSIYFGTDAFKTFENTLWPVCQFPSVFVVEKYAQQDQRVVQCFEGFIRQIDLINCARRLTNRPTLPLYDRTAPNVDTPAESRNATPDVSAAPMEIIEDPKLDTDRKDEQQQEDPDRRRLIKPSKEQSSTEVTRKRGRDEASPKEELVKINQETPAPKSSTSQPSQPKTEKKTTDEEVDQQLSQGKLRSRRSVATAFTIRVWDMRDNRREILKFKPDDTFETMFKKVALEFKIAETVNYALVLMTPRERFDKESWGSSQITLSEKNLRHCQLRLEAEMPAMPEHSTCNTDNPVIRFMKFFFSGVFELFQKVVDLLFRVTQRPDHGDGLSSGLSSSPVGQSGRSGLRSNPARRRGPVTLHDLDGRSEKTAKRNTFDNGNSTIYGGDGD